LEGSGETMKYYGQLISVTFETQGRPGKTFTFERVRDNYYKLINGKFKVYDETIEEATPLPLDRDYMRIFGTITIKRIEFLTSGGARKTRKMRR